MTDRLDELAELLTGSEIVGLLVDFYQEDPKPQPSPRPRNFGVMREALEGIKKEEL